MPKQILPDVVIIMDKVVILQGLNPNVMPSVVNIEEVLESNAKQQEEVSAKSVSSQKQRNADGPTDTPSASPAERSTPGETSLSDKDAEHSETSHADENGEFDFDLNFGAADGHNYEELGTLLSAFFQDEKGTNIVDAIRENSRVHLKIARTLEKILKVVDTSKKS